MQGQDWRGQERYFLYNLERITEVLCNSADIEHAIQALIDEMLDIFQADRAWLLSPCDPSASHWRVPVESTTADYPGAFDLGKEQPMDAGIADIFVTALQSDGPVTLNFSAAAGNFPPWAERFQVRSQMCMALSLQHDTPWLLGLHHCRSERDWTPAEQRLFQATGLRVTEVLDRMLLTRSLQEDVEQRKKVEQDLQRRVAMERLVADIAGHLVGVSSRNWDAQMNAILARLGAFAGVDRSYLFQLSADGQTLSNTHEWCAPGIAPQLDALKALATDRFGWPLEQLARGKVLNIPDINGVPAAAAELRGWLAQGGIQSLVNVPVRVADKLIGLIGFDAVRAGKQWSSEDIALLETVAALLASAQARRESEVALSHSEIRLAKAQQIAHLGSWELDLTNNELYWSDEVYRIFEIDPDRFAATYDAFVATLHPEDRAEVDRAFQAALECGEPYDIVHRLLLPDGRIKYVHETCEIFLDASRRPTRAIGIVHDITRQRRAELLSARLGRILEHSWNEIYAFDATTFRLLEISDGACRNLGYSLEALQGMTLLQVVPDFTPTQLETLLRPLRRGEEQQVTLETEQRRQDGSHYPVEMRLQLSNMEQPPVFIAISQDISERKRYIAELEHKSLYDVLTELPNRTLLHDRLHQALKEMSRAAQPLAVVVVDVMRLKEVNDILGHRHGDQVLQEVARRLHSNVRESDTIARLGGDEFALILPTMDLQRMVIAADKIGQSFEAPFVLDETPLDIDVALGVALYPDHGDSADVLLQHADIAMRVAKNEHTGFSIYNPDDDPFSRRRLRLHGELRQAIADNALALYYQPKIHISSGRVVSVEALARWPHPIERMIAPTDFVPMIEQSGLIRPFTNWVLEQAIRQCGEWMQQGIALNVAVNISTRNLLDPELTASIAGLLQKYGVNPRHITLEITESAVMARPENAVKVLSELHQMGLRIAIDDFGTGYSSLAYLKKMPVDELKIDASFVSEIVDNESDAVIVRSTIDLAHNLGLKVVAEGVESKAILSLLAVLGCDLAQGYHFSAPLCAADFERWLAASSWSKPASG